jgi:hypothetical protein
VSVIPNAEARSNVIYIAGPMTGLEEFNFPAFNSAADKFKSDGWEVKNPAEHGVVEGATWEDYMAFDLTQLGQCGAVYMLKGWEMSRGACLEQLIAMRLGMKIIYEDRV